MLFFLANIMIPGDITNNFMPGLGAQRAVLQERYGLNQPLWAQYLTFMQAFITGNLGTSGFGQPISEIMAQLLPWTLLIFVFAVGIAFVMGHWLGRVTGWTNRPVLKHIIRFSAVTAHSTFPPFLTFFLAFAVSNLLGPMRWAASDCWRPLERSATLIEHASTKPQPQSSLAKFRRYPNRRPHPSTQEVLTVWQSSLLTGML